MRVKQQRKAGKKEMEGVRQRRVKLKQTKPSTRVLPQAIILTHKFVGLVTSEEIGRAHV